MCVCVPVCGVQVLLTCAYDENTGSGVEAAPKENHNPSYSTPARHTPTVHAILQARRYEQDKPLVGPQCRIA